MRHIATLLIVVAGMLAGCALNEDVSPDHPWIDGQCTPLDENGHGTCDIRVPRTGVIVMPVEERAREIWRQEHKAMYIRPFAGDVVAVITTDQQGGFTYMSKQDLATTGLGERALWRQALRNVERYSGTASITVFEDELRGLYWVASDEISAVALVFSKSLWKREEFQGFRGPPLVGLDSRDSFLVADSGDARAVAALRAAFAHRHACGALDDYPGFCSRAGHLFVRTQDGKWSVFAQ